MSTALVRSTTLLRLDVFARHCGLHPDLVRRFVELGLIEPARLTSGELWFRPSQVSRVGRMQRLRQDLALNYNALALVLDLLDRIDQLERTSPRGASPTTGETTWTPND